MSTIRKLFILLFLCFIGSIEANASSNSINSIDISIQLDEKGTAYVQELWNMNVREGTEVYKVMSNMGNSEIKNFKVREESKIYHSIPWNTKASFEEKKYKSGIHNISNGYELCWGMSQYGNHSYQISYYLTNFVSNLEDKQMIYWQLVNKGMDPSPSKVRVVISAPTPFPDTTPVWGYGYKGYAYVKDGKIYMESETGISRSEYMVLLANFDPHTFQTTNDLEGTFDDWFQKAEKGKFSYNYNSRWETLKSIIIVSLFMIFFFGIVIFISVMGDSNVSGIKGVFDFKDKGRKFKEVNYFRDIPCKKDIYRAYFLATLYGLTKKRTDFLGSNLLKWLNEGKIEIITNSNKKKKDNSILLKQSPVPEFELSLYNKIYSASKDGILEKKEFGNWCSYHYKEVLNWFTDVLEFEKKELLNEGSLKQVTKKQYKFFDKTVIEIDDSLRREAEQLAGLRKFLLDFSDMKNKEAIEVHLWKEYLMFAQIFGIADKVAKQFKNLYPDVITDMDYTDVIFVNHISYYGTSQAISARSAAESYNSGGGGFSSGGGGGGSFGGGFGGGTR